MADVAWFIEWPAHNGNPMRWWAGADMSEDRSDWTTDPNRAIRFCRESDAARTAQSLPGLTEANLQCTQHLWLSGEAVAHPAPPFTLDVGLSSNGWPTITSPHIPALYVSGRDMPSTLVLLLRAFQIIETSFSPNVEETLKQLEFAAELAQSVANGHGYGEGMSEDLREMLTTMAAVHRHAAGAIKLLAAHPAGLSRACGPEDK